MQLQLQRWSQRIGLGLLILGLINYPLSPAPATEPQLTLTVFHAGSLAVPFRELNDLFRQSHPEVKLEAEAAGSRDTARKISDLDRHCDVLSSADYRVIDDLLIPQHASFNIRFATNEMAIAYTKRSRYADEINAANWYEVLLRADVCFGRADPNRDPCGYRTEMTFQLAELHYGKPGLAAALLERFGKKYLRPKGTDLLGLLEAGEIDYLFSYRSIIKQHDLECLLLPDEINLKSPDLADFYAQATVEVSGATSETTSTYYGTPVLYGVTIPRNSHEPKLAEEYLALLLSPAGQAVLERNGQPALVPAPCEQYMSLPESLKPYCTALKEAP